MSITKLELAKLIGAVILLAGILYFLFAMFTATPEQLEPNSQYKFQCVYVRDSYRLYDATNGETFFFVGNDGRSHQILLDTYDKTYDFYCVYERFGGHVFKVLKNETAPGSPEYTVNYKIYGVKHGIVDLGFEKVVTSYGCDSDNDGQVY